MKTIIRLKYMFYFLGIGYFSLPQVQSAPPLKGGVPYDESAKPMRSSDPSGYPDGINNQFYACVPTMSIDPCGLETISSSKNVKVDVSELFDATLRDYVLNPIDTAVIYAMDDLDFDVILTAQCVDGVISNFSVELVGKSKTGCTLTVGNIGYKFTLTAVNTNNGTLDSTNTTSEKSSNGKTLYTITNVYDVALSINLKYSLIMNDNYSKLLSPTSITIIYTYEK